MQTFTDVLVKSVTHTVSTTGTTAPASSDSDYSSGIAVGSTHGNDAGNGRIVIVGPTQTVVFSYVSDAPQQWTVAF